MGGGVGGQGPKEVWAGTKRHLKGQKAGSTRSEFCPFVMNDNNHHPVAWTGALAYLLTPPGCHVVQSLSQVQLFAMPWTAVPQASLFFTMASLMEDKPLACILGRDDFPKGNRGAFMKEE